MTVLDDLRKQLNDVRAEMRRPKWAAKQAAWIAAGLIDSGQSEGLLACAISDAFAATPRPTMDDIERALENTLKELLTHPPILMAVALAIIDDCKPM